MSKKLVLGIFLIMAMAIASTAVVAVKDVNITDSEVTLSGISGDKTGYMHIKNIGTETVNITFSSTILVDNSGHSLELTDFSKLTNVYPTQSSTASFKANLDGYAGNYTGVITAQVEGDPASDSVMVKVQIQDNGLGLSVTPSVTDSTETDAVVEQVIHVNNLANKDITATITKSGYSGLTFTIDKSGTYSFPALSETNVTATIVVPVGAASRVYTGTVEFDTSAADYTSTLQTIVQPTYKASVPQLSISVDPGSTSSGNLVISNTGNINLTGLSIVNIPQLVDNDGDIINLSVTPASSINVNVGSTATANVQASASSKMDSGEYTGTLTLTGSGINQQFNVKVNVRDILQISDINIDDDTLKPGDKIKIDVEVENIAEDVDLEDVEIEVYFLDGGSRLEDDDGDDIEDESDKFDLDAGDSETVNFEFTMPYGVDDGDEFTVHIEARGKNADDNSEKYKVVDEENTLTAEKEKHQLEFFDVRLDADTLSCSRSTYLRVSIRNIGDKDEDDVELAITNAELGISKHVIFDITNDPEDDEFEVEKSFLLELQGAPTGTYDIYANVYYDDDNEEEETSIPLTIASCSGSTSSSSSSSTSGSYTPPSEPTGANDEVEFIYTGGPSAGQSVVSATAATPRISSTAPKESWTDSIAFLILVGLANILLVIVIIVAVVMLVKK